MQNAAAVIPLYAFTALAVFMGARAALDDYRTGKIRNRHILAGFAGGVLLNVIFVAYFSFAGGETAIRWDYILKIAVNTACAFACGLFIWKTSSWSAGDAKLFTLFAFLAPLEFYSRGYIDYFPAFNLLINIFAVSFLSVVLKIAWHLALPGDARRAEQPLKPLERLREARETLSEKWPQFLVMFMVFNLLFLALDSIRSNIKSPEAHLLLNIAFLVFIFAAVKPLSQSVGSLLKRLPGAKYWALALIPAAACAIIATRSGAAVAKTAKTITAFMVFVGIFRKVIDIYLKNADVVKVKVGNLEPGMIPTDSAKEKLNGNIDLGAIFMDGFTREQVELIQSKTPVEDEMEISKTVPFAPSALGGLLLTIVLKQSVIHFLMSSFSK